MDIELPSANLKRLLEEKAILEAKNSICKTNKNDTDNTEKTIDSDKDIVMAASDNEEEQGITECTQYVEDSRRERSRKESVDETTADRERNSGNQKAVNTLVHKIEVGV